jgi:precorrin-3B C17-methyltransferase
MKSADLELVSSKLYNVVLRSRLAQPTKHKESKRHKRKMTKLYLIGTGPGAADLVAPRAKAAVEASDELVAYGLYLDLLGSVCDGKVHHDLPLGQEIDRARLALDLASQGKKTALISSGDIGIYAMATLVFELLEQQLLSPDEREEKGIESKPDWLAVDIEVVPGISAMQAGSARIGAMLGHDFCTISLSDLLTPWQTIEKRLHACGQGDFVVSFYNPRSKKRDWQINTARDILLEYRPANTPVLLGRQLSREDESITITTLDKLDAADVDMFTMVSVGNSETKHINYINNNGRQSWVYTPRGYSKKL